MTTKSPYDDVDVYRHEEHGEVWWGAEVGLKDDLSMGLEREADIKLPCWVDLQGQQ
ncbi:hypothetical protein [Frigoribacterium sp. PvP032]|uniref:hypothetical protein n=1 Tax=Frigoribacterium sp. PvP032 TaxID=2806589 RepID=UPI001AE8932D|nr:hypothetical protein [Frigoribacterium sp. PvP032]MBP1189201.1 hypothetical protein [Frigoribacterium sp. PvP032]